MWPSSPLLPKAGGLGGTQTQTQASGATWPASGGSRGLSQPQPALAQSPAQPPPRGGLGGGVGVLLHFQVFPALGQRGSLTNQLLQAHTVWGGAQPEAARPVPGCGCGSGRWAHCRPSWGSPPGSLAPGCCSWWCWAGPSPASAWVSGGPRRGAPRQTLGAGAPAGVIRPGSTPPTTPTNRERQPQGQWALDPHACLHGPRAHPLHATDNLLGPGREGHGHHVLPGAATLCAGRALRCRRHRLAGGGLQQRWVPVQVWGLG